MKKIILMRHSIPDKSDNFINEEIPLSKEGVLKAEIFFKQPEFYNIKYVYSSTYRKAFETAKIYTDNIIKDNRIIERSLGNVDTLDNSFWKKQYEDYNYKNINGESLNEVCIRMDSCIKDIIKNMNNEENSLVVSHATAICAYLTKYCKITVIDEKEKIRKIDYNKKTILLGKIDTPSMFVLSFDNDKLIDIMYKEVYKWNY